MGATFWDAEEAHKAVQVRHIVYHFRYSAPKCIMMKKFPLRPGVWFSSKAHALHERNLGLTSNITNKQKIKPQAFPQ